MKEIFLLVSYLISVFMNEVQKNEENYELDKKFLKYGVLVKQKHNLETWLRFSLFPQISLSWKEGKRQRREWMGDIILQIAHIISREGVSDQWHLGK